MDQHSPRRDLPRGHCYPYIANNSQYSPLQSSYDYRSANLQLHTISPWIQKDVPLTLVLVHGSWADASFWNEIAHELRQMGHTVYTPEYPGHGSDPNKAVTHAMMSSSLVDYIRSRNLHDIVLVGHSFGGTLIQKIVEEVSDHVKRLVFLNAFVLLDGQSIAEELPPTTLAVFEDLRQNSLDDTIPLPFPLFRETFVNLASLGLAEQLYHKIMPEPAAPLYEELDLKIFYNLTIPKSYIHFTEDSVLQQGSSEYGWHPHMSERLGLFRFIQSGGDHFSTVKTNSRMVAQKIHLAARD